MSHGDEAGDDEELGADDDDEANEFLGQIGENNVLTWCSEAHISANKSRDHDGRGWDIFAMLPRSKSDAPPAALDLRNAEANALLQVKATRNQRSTKVRLSNWERMVRWPNPAFFVVTVVGANEKVERAYLVHVDETLIARVLKRLRKEPVSAAGELNKRVMRLTWSEDQRLPELSGRALLQGLESSIGPDLAKYVAWKISAEKNLGYGKARVQVSITFSKGISHEDLADFAIGLRKELPIRASETRDLRFDVPVTEKSLENLERSHIQIESAPSLGDTRVEIVDKEQTQLVALKCSTHSARAFFPFLPAESEKIALRTGRVTFILRPPAEGSPFNLSWSVVGAERLSLGEAVQHAKMLRLLTNPKQYGTRLRFQLLGSASPVVEVAAGNVNEQIDPEIAEHAATTELLWSVARHFDVGGDEIVAETEIAGQAQRIRFLSEVLTPSAAADIQIRLDRADDEAASAERVAVLLPVPLFVGDLVVVVIVGVVGKPTIEGERILLDRPKLRFLQHAKVRRADLRNFGHAPLFQRANEILETEGVTCVRAPAPNANLPFTWSEREEHDHEGSATP